MYTVINFKTKKALKDAVTAYNAYAANPDLWKLNNMAPGTIGAVLGTMPRLPRAVTIFAPGMGQPKDNGREFVEGPHYPALHTWYAAVEVVNGLVVKVK